MPKLPPNRGLLAAILAFVIWGGFPVYWKLLGSINSLELLWVRLMLTAATCFLLLPLRGTWPEFRNAWRDPTALKSSLLAALLLSGNWLAFIWVVNTGKVLESSLGYFLCPLVSVVLGRFIEGERINRRQKAAVALAGAGVAVMILLAGRIPIAALVIALTWSGYGLMKKRSSFGPVVGLGLETSLLSPIAAMVLVMMAFQAPITLSAATTPTLCILAVSGILTAAPLLLFAYAAPRIRLSTLGMGQYIVPSGHFILAGVYGEAINLSVLCAFGLIWSGLLIYALPRGETKSV